MIIVENRFCIFYETSGFSLLVDDVTSCVTDEKIHDSVVTQLSIDEAMALGRALVDAAQVAETARADKQSAFHAAVQKALAAARAQVAEKTSPNPPREDA